MSTINSIGIKIKALTHKSHWFATVVFGMVSGFAAEAQEVQLPKDKKVWVKDGEIENVEIEITKGMLGYKMEIKAIRRHIGVKRIS